MRGSGHRSRRRPASTTRGGSSGRCRAGYRMSSTCGSRRSTKPATSARPARRRRSRLTWRCRRHASSASSRRSRDYNTRMDSLTFLEQAGGEPRPVYVVHGDEDFLKRQVLAALRARALGEGDDSFGLSVHAGDKAVWRDIHSELQTLPFLSPRRLVLVENAEPFVSAYRTQ